MAKIFGIYLKPLFDPFLVRITKLLATLDARLDRLSIFNAVLDNVLSDVRWVVCYRNDVIILISEMHDIPSFPLFEIVSLIDLLLFGALDFDLVGRLADNQLVKLVLPVHVARVELVLESLKQVKAFALEELPGSLLIRKLNF